jgi:hypothetical protein
MVKKLIRIALLLVVLVLVLAVVAVIYMDTAARKTLVGSVERLGDVTCEVQRVDVRLLRQGIRIEGLAVSNPKGFPQANMLSTGSADVEVEVGTLWNQPVHVRRLEIHQPVVRVEAGAAGKTNVGVFLANVQEKLGEPKPREGEPTRLKIDRLVIKDAQVQIGSGITAANLMEIPLAEVELADVHGKDGEGVTSGELAAMIVFEMARRGAIKAGINPMKLIPPDLLEGINDLLDVRELIQDAPEKILEGPLRTLIGGEDKEE